MAAGRETVQQLTGRGEIEDWLGWSPEGGQIAFDLDPDGQREIFVLDLRTGEATNLTSHSADD